MKKSYFVRTKEFFDTVQGAVKHLDNTFAFFHTKMDVGYHLPQPQYKAWVPLWLIRLITKTDKP